MTLSYKKFLALILISITTLSVFTFSNTASAQEQETTLQPTQVVADIPEQYNEIFQIQWGGGSLYQLKQRLATMSCIVDTVFVYDNNQWNAYNQYQVPSTLTEQFRAEYSQLIPAGTLYASCYNICEFEYIGVQYDGVERCRTFEDIQPSSAGDLPCTDDFEPAIKEQVLNILPVMPDICVVKGVSSNPIAYNWAIFQNYNTLLYVNSYPFIVITHIEFPAGISLDFLSVEAHELCHSSQNWHTVQALQPDNPIQTHYAVVWHQTQASKEFITITGFTQDNGIWTLPSNTVWKEGEIYGTVSPEELSAELCSFYLIEKTGDTDRYDPKIFNTYLTPEIREWIETYVVLPTITETE